MVDSNSSVVSRSPQCLFQSTQKVNALQYIDIIGTFGRESLWLQVHYAKIIRGAAHNISKTMGGSPTNGGMHTFLQLESRMGQLRTLLPLSLTGKSSTIYIMTDDQRSMKEMDAICRIRSCHFLSDYTHLNGQMRRSEGEKSSKCLPLNLLCAVTPVEYFEFTIGDKGRIYSPFVSENPGHNEYDKDSFDQFGDFGDCVANAANSFIWGPEGGR